MLYGDKLTPVARKPSLDQEEVRQREGGRCRQADRRPERQAERPGADKRRV